MRYLSVCSGVEAATVAWHPLGWEAVGYSEIEKFPSEVLAHHYPNTPNFGDMTKYKEWNTNGTVELLVGGTPCQSFSVAGLRKGLEDPRGNLALTFGAIAERFKPKYIVWENVPGVLSSNKGEDFKAFLDMLEELGYICDIDILDARLFGVPQRRRRVFVCGQSVDYLLSRMTTSSEQTIMQCLLEILHAILIGQLQLSEKELVKLGLANLSKDGAWRRMKLFGLHGEGKNWQKFQDCLVGVYQRYQHELNQSGVAPGEKEKELIQADLFSDFQEESQSIFTEQSLKKLLEEVYEVMKSSITLMGINSITQRQIFLCSRVVLLIGKLIPHLNQSCPVFWSLKSSSLTSLKGYINYARQTSREFFNDMDWIQSWDDFIREANGEVSSIGCLGDGESAAKVLFERESLLRNPPPSREARKETPAFAPSSFGNYSEGVGTLRRDGGDLGGGSETLVTTNRLVAFGEYSDDGTASTLKARDYKDHTDLIVYETHPADSRVKEMGEVCQTVTSRWGTGGGNVPLVQSVSAIALQDVSGREKKQNGRGWNDDEVMYTLDAAATQGVAYSIQGSMIGRELHNGPQGSGFNEDVSFTLNTTDRHAVAHAFNENASVMQNMAVRRLTPVECERLQGFKDNYTNIPWRGKPDSPDAPRYKAMGNSMAVPVMAWIGKRIQEVEDGKA